jgi:hypothetical protein
MSTAASSVPVASGSLLRPILVGGALAGTFDLTAAFISFGFGNPRLIAGGLLGRQAIHGGAGTWILGVVLHYFIALSAAAIYCLSSRRLGFLKSHSLVCGLFSGIAVFLVMKLVVLPLCAYHFMGTYQYRGLVQGLLVHMLIIGLPISLSLNRLEGR